MLDFPTLRRFALLVGVLATACAASAQKPDVTNPGKPAEPHFDPKQKLPPLAGACRTTNGKVRTYFCEFIVEQLAVAGSPQPPLKNPAWGKPGMGLTLYRSKAKSQKPLTLKGLPYQELTYDLVFTIRRVAKAAKPTAEYALLDFIRPSAKGGVQPANLLIGDVGKTPSLWQPMIKSPLATAVGETQQVTGTLTVLVDASSNIVTKTFADPVEKNLTADLRLFLLNPATVQVLSGYNDLRDFAEWSVQIQLVSLP